MPDSRRKSRYEQSEVDEAVSRLAPKPKNTGAMAFTLGPHSTYTPDALPGQFMCRPVVVGGPEVEGGPYTMTPVDPYQAVLWLGKGPPPAAGTAVVAERETTHWVADYPAGPGGVTGPGQCHPCTIPPNDLVCSSWAIHQPRGDRVDHIGTTILHYYPTGGAPLGGYSDGTAWWQNDCGDAGAVFGPGGVCRFTCYQGLINWTVDVYSDCLNCAQVAAAQATQPYYNTTYGSVCHYLPTQGYGLFSAQCSPFEMVFYTLTPTSTLYLKITG